MYASCAARALPLLPRVAVLITVIIVREFIRSHCVTCLVGGGGGAYDLYFYSSISLFAVRYTIWVKKKYNRTRLKTLVHVSCDGVCILCLCYCDIGGDSCAQYLPHVCVTLCTKRIIAFDVFYARFFFIQLPSAGMVSTGDYFFSNLRSRAFFYLEITF